MIRVKATTPIPLFEQVGDNITRAPAIFNTAWARQQGRIRSYAKQTLKVKPGKPKYPIKWTSPRQRRFVMAKLRREGNLPYKRTDAMINAWDVSFTATIDGGSLTLFNPSESAEFVVGDEQQGFHAETGWYRVDDVQKRISDFAATTLVQTWVTAVDPFAGVPQT